MKGTRNFLQMLKEQWARGHSVCVGVDSAFSKIPESAKRAVIGKAGSMPEVEMIDPKIIEEIIVRFNVEIVDATADLVCAYKPNLAFYAKHGTSGVSALARTIAYIQGQYSEVPVILDAKYGDIGNSNERYVQTAFNIFNADAVTVHPYLGQEAMQPFLDQRDKGIIVLCRTSNSGAGEFQNLPIGREPLCNVVARQVAEHWNENNNCAVVVGATYPEDLQEIRKIVGNMPILIPGIGKQGGDLKKTVEAGGREIIINSSRGVIFASNGSDFAQAARDEIVRLNESISQYQNG